MASVLTPGAELPQLVHAATRLQLFRFSAVTWNPHRIHFEEGYAHSEGHPGTLVHSHLRAALALRCVTEGLPDWEPVAVRYRVRRPVTDGTTLTYGARVSGVSAGTVTLDLHETLADGTVGLEGTVTVRRRTEENA